MHEKLPVELEALELALAGLVPSPSRIDRDHLMFRAGQASMASATTRPHTAWYWQSATATALAVSVAMFVVLLGRPGGQTTPQVVAVAPAVGVRIPRPGLTAEPANSYLKLRNRLLDSNDALAALPVETRHAPSRQVWPRTRDAWSENNPAGVPN